MGRVMGRNPRALHCFLRLRWFFLALMLAGTVASVYAAGSGSVRVTPQSTRLQGPGAAATWTEWAVSTTTTRPTTTLDAVVTATEYATTRGALSSSTIGGLARKAIRGGVYGAAVGLAVEGIIDGAGWAIKELQDQVYDPGSKEQLEGYGYCVDEYPRDCAPTPDGLIQWGIARGGSRPDGRWITEETYPGRGYVKQLAPAGYLYSFYGYSLRQRPATGWDGYTNWSPGADPSPVTDDELGDAIRQHPDVVASLLTDPRTGRPVMTPELQQQMEDLKRQIEEREGIPTGEPSPVPDLEDDTAKDDGSPWPSFCGWASVVCNFFEWVKSDDSDTQKPEVPWDEESPSDVTQQWSSGLGGGSCPSPVSFSVSLGGVSSNPEFSFEPVCQFGTIMRPVIIALASIVAGLIIAGVRGAKDA